MSKFIDNLKDLFGYSRRERNACMVLLILILLIILVRSFINRHETPIDISCYVVSTDSLNTNETEKSANFHKDLNASNTASSTTVRQKYYNKKAKTSKGNPYNNVYSPDSGNKANRYDVYSNKSYHRTYDIVELNACDSAMLEALPGIGSVLSARIIKYRNLLGGFHSIQQLKEVYGMSNELFDIASPWIIVDSTSISKININSADFKTLIRMPYLDRNDVNAILKYKKLMERINNIGDLTKNGIITENKAAKISPYMDYTAASEQ